MKDNNQDATEHDDFQRVYEGGSKVSQGDNMTTPTKSAAGSNKHKCNGNAKSSKWWRWKPDHMM